MEAIDDIPLDMGGNTGGNKIGQLNRHLFVHARSQETEIGDNKESCRCTGTECGIQGAGYL